MRTWAEDRMLSEVLAASHIALVVRTEAELIELLICQRYIKTDSYN